MPLCKYPVKEPGQGVSWCQGKSEKCYFGFCSGWLFCSGWPLSERRGAVLLPRLRLLAGMPEACPAPASWLAHSPLERRPTPALLRPNTFAPPKTPHHHQPSLRSITCQQPQRHMYCQPLWLKVNDFRNTSRPHTSIQAKQL